MVSVISAKIGLLVCGFLVAGFSDVVRAEESVKLSEKEALQMAERWATALSQSQVEELANLLSDRYQHIHGTGLVESKESVIEALRSGARKYDPIQLEDLQARLFGDCAVVSGKFALKVLTKGKTIEGLIRFSLTMVRTGSRLEIVSFQATLLPPTK